MSYINFNPNPDRKLVGDCVIRAISKAMNQSWDDTYIGIMLQGYAMHDMPSSNDVWGRYLFERGTGIFVLRGIVNNPTACFARYNVEFTGNISIPTGGAISYSDRYCGLRGKS